ncbi:unnamed protein product [Cuscuta campestris]|uniref:Uncharacterized protein n=1 Tax=Cuscuta campestris TaxID=132261 RepID=A0A484LQP5_9ASTE|nr:unnamed protein product [Cuscuta campestris]
MDQRRSKPASQPKDIQFEFSVSRVSKALKGKFTSGGNRSAMELASAAESASISVVLVGAEKNRAAVNGNGRK